MKRFVCLVFAMLLIGALLVPAAAASTDKGTIEIKVRYAGKDITGGDLIAVRVGYADTEKNVFRRVIIDTEITGIGEATTVTELQNFYIAYKQTFKFDTYKTEVKNGIGKITDIPQGLYLVYQQTPASGYNVLPSFLVSVPYNGNLNVTIASKPELELKPEEVPETTAPKPSDEEKLPQTGQLTWPIPWLCVSGVALFVLGWWMCFGRREDF